jgi:AP-4 complex subunit epsilon-1
MIHVWIILQCNSLIDELSTSHSTDLQQRAYELQALLGLGADIVECVIPLDASCEDIEASFYLHFPLVFYYRESQLFY